MELGRKLHIVCWMFDHKCNNEEHWNNILKKVCFTKSCNTEGWLCTVFLKDWTSKHIENATLVKKVHLFERVGTRSKG